MFNIESVIKMYEKQLKNIAKKKKEKEKPFVNCFIN